MSQSCLPSCGGRLAPVVFAPTDRTVGPVAKERRLVSQHTIGHFEEVD